MAANGAQGGRVPLSWLLLRHFPKWLTSLDKESLLTHFGAVEVVVMPTRGRMKHTVFAAFPNLADATQAMGKLHQLQVFGNRLVVEYARAEHKHLMLEAERDRWACNKTPRSGEEDMQEEEEEEEGSAERTAPKREHSRDPVPAASTVRYCYPPATPSTLTNITSALMCVPEFYQQVLHLMNRMNLPPPFGALTPAPPMFAASTQEIMVQGQTVSEGEGSEIESDEEQRENRLKKRKSPPVTQHTAKRRKISYQQLKTLQASLKKAPGVEEATEQHGTNLQKAKIELKVPSELVPPTESAGTIVTYIAPVSSIKEEQPLGSAGEEMASQPGEKEEEEEEVGEFVSLNELNRNRLTQAERRKSNVYKNYSPGEVSTRLYVKNLAKQVEAKDLQFIFGRYIDWESETHKNIFDIRLMQTGRMKGQAFVGLPDEGVAARALKETNGYILHGKPMVVHFARSSKPKDSQ